MLRLFRSFWTACQHCFCSVCECVRIDVTLHFIMLPFVSLSGWSVLAALPRLFFSVAAFIHEHWRCRWSTGIRLGSQKMFFTGVGLMDLNFAVKHLFLNILCPDPCIQLLMRKKKKSLQKPVFFITCGFLFFLFSVIQLMQLSHVSYKLRYLGSADLCLFIGCI